MRCTSTEALRNLWLSYGRWSLYHITLYQINTTTHAVHWVTQKIWFQKVPISKTTLNSVTLNFIVALSDNTSCYVTTIAFLTRPIYYKLENAQWSDEYSVHRINPDINFLCELHVTVKLYRAECSLYDVDSNFFPNYKNSCSCSLLNVCTTALECIGTNVRLSKGKWSSKFKEI